jgi:hydroxyacylglutathione hydrolase
MVSVVPIDTPSLGDRSYLVSDGEIAVVIDPQRDIDRALQLAGATGVRITRVFETHVHNDYVSAGSRGRLRAGRRRRRCLPTSGAR